jgi:uncharacterized protein YcbX
MVQRPVGAVASILRYPVKSMRGEQVEQTSIGERGLLGDRAYAIRECETGFIASAKYPRKWAALLTCVAAYAEPPQPDRPLPPVLITLPDGKAISSAQPACNQLLSAFLGRAVELVGEVEDPIREADRTPIDAPPLVETIRQESMGAAAPHGTFFDYATIHILTTATLARLQALYPAGHIEAARFRPNLVIETLVEESGFAENGWLGSTLTLGSGIKLDIIDPSPRCVVTTLPQGQLPRDPGILRTVTQHNAAVSVTAAPGVLLKAVAGVYARAQVGGSVGLGELVNLHRERNASDGQLPIAP